MIVPPRSSSNASDNTGTLQPVASNFSVYTHQRKPGPVGRRELRSSYGRYAAVHECRQMTAFRSAPANCLVRIPAELLPRQHGYDVTYVSNSDMVRPERGLKCNPLSASSRRVLGPPPIRERRQMRDTGVNPSVPVGKCVCWVTPLRAAMTAGGADSCSRGPYGGTTIRR